MIVYPPSASVVATSPLERVTVRLSAATLEIATNPAITLGSKSDPVVIRPLPRNLRY